MRTTNMIPAAVAAMLCVFGGVASAQEYRGSYQDQMACTPDVFRLCGQHVPDSTRITACLRENTSRLSGPCRAVFASNTNARRNADAGRDARPYERQGPPSYERYDRQGPPVYEQRQVPPSYEQRPPNPYGRPSYYEDY